MDWWNGKRQEAVQRCKGGKVKSSGQVDWWNGGLVGWEGDRKEWASGRVGWEEARGGGEW
ncbi:MAG: hypothetical protein EBS00_07865 [Verrucomicrobia bacterium]|nr:hypothetical protein [Verrucomicrobiota bacterium]